MKKTETMKNAFNISVGKLEGGKIKMDPKKHHVTM
jgi:hypothetical protein